MACVDILTLSIGQYPRCLHVTSFTYRQLSHRVSPSHRLHHHSSGGRHRPVDCQNTSAAGTRPRRHEGRAQQNEDVGRTTLRPSRHRVGGDEGHVRHNDPSTALSTVAKGSSPFPQDQMFGAEGSQSVQLDNVLDGLMLQYIRQTPSQQSQPLAGK